MSNVHVRVQGPPERCEAAPYYFNYIDLVPAGDVVDVLEAQLEPASAFLLGISDERSLHRYAPDKWSIRGVLNHVNDCERLFAFRAFWFARGFDSELPSFDEKTAAGFADADAVSWARHVRRVPGRPPRRADPLPEPAERGLVTEGHRKRQPVHRARAHMSTSLIFPPHLGQTIRKG